MTVNFFCLLGGWVVGSKSFGGQPELVVWRLSVWGKCGRLKQVVKNSVCGWVGCVGVRV